MTIFDTDRLRFSPTPFAPLSLCAALCVTNRKSAIGNFGIQDGGEGQSGFFELSGFQYPKWGNPMERYDRLSNVFLEFIKKIASDNNVLVGIEGYSFGSAGKVFNLAENAGILKYKLYSSGIPYIEIAPTVVKKHAVGKGNAKKPEMEKAFNDLHYLGKPVLRETFGMQKTKAVDPIVDIVDSYFIANFVWNNYAIIRS